MKIRTNKIHNTATAVLVSLFILFAACSEALATQTVKITNYTYRHNCTTGTPIIFSTTFRNTGDAIAPPNQYAYVQVVLTNSVTGAEIDPGGATATTNLAPGAIFTSTTTWTAIPGKYTVALIVFGSVDGVTEQRLATIYGAFPLVVGTSPATEKLQAFPGSFDFGIIPYGRHMHPIPLLVTWDFFLFNVNGEQQAWYMRIYTDNTTRFKGIENTVHMLSPAGLVSSDGKYTIPLKVWCLNYPPDDQEMGWDTKISGPPPVDDDTYWEGPLLDNGKRNEEKAGWVRIPDYSEMTSDSGTWRNLIGQDITNTHYVTDITRTGDFTLSSPFSVYFATETDPTSVKGSYSCNLILEIYAP